ncbi:YppE family protein [Neobacillus niacini]|uniref:YppE family protein n=1 Tax=Neobacillus niacini TaxID=86668 RepID=UPI0021CB51B3|nr:YppE family protein [Neobacillus niacini]MCM3766604.1 YppE family protein [Neobacillus niacini]
MLERLIYLTESLFRYNRLFLQYYQEARETGEKQDFEKTIKPFVNEVKDSSDEWQKLMRQWLSKVSPKHIHLKQIDTTASHIEQLSVQAFFGQTSKTRFLNSQRTVEFFLAEVLTELEKKKRDA